MKKTERYPSYAACVATILSNSPQPLNMETLINQVASHRPLGKSARSAVYRAINQLFQAVPVAPGCYGWLSHLLAGTHYRHTLASEEVRRGFLLLDELEHTVFFPQFFQSYRPDGRVLSIELDDGPTIRAEASVERRTWSLRLEPEFIDWVDRQGGQNRDDLLISVVDASQGQYRFRLQLREMRDAQRIQARNYQLAYLAEQVVAEDKRARTAIPTWELVARLIARNAFNEAPPPDDLHSVLHEYSRLRFIEGAGYALSDRAKNATYYPGFALDLDDQLVFDSVQEAEADDYGVWIAQIEDEPDNTPTGDSCPDYEAYLQNCAATRSRQTPLSHEEYHLLEAELEMLVRLQHEFGRLLDEQAARKEALADQLFIDPDTYFESDWDDPAIPGDGEPPFWAN